MLTTTISELEDLFYDYLFAIVPDRDIKYITNGNYPQTNKPSVFIVTNPFIGNTHPVVGRDDGEVETVTQVGAITFTVDVVGGSFQADTAKIQGGFWSANFWKTIGTKSGLGEIATGQDLSRLETGTIKGRYQFSITLHCILDHIQQVETYDNLNATICASDHINDCIDINTEDSRECQL